MNKTLKVLLILSLVAFSAGCKLAVIVVEGGEVQSTNSGICIASAICIVDVDDPNFSEKFEAVPFTGWYFEEWNEGSRFFCGGSPEPICALSFEGYEESKSVEEMVASSETFYLMPIFRSQINESIVEVDGKEWLQPVDFGGYSYDQVASVCPPPSGVCSGSLPNSNFELTGYQFATDGEFSELVDFYNKEPDAAKKFFEDFDPNAGDVADTILYSLARESPPKEGGVITITAGDNEGVGGLDYDTASLDELDYDGSEIGGTWFWRAVE